MNFTTKVHEAANFTHQVLGYKMNDLGLLYEAIHASDQNGTQSNKRLALVGDGALAMAIKAAWHPSGASVGTSPRKEGRSVRI